MTKAVTFISTVFLLIGCQSMNQTRPCKSYQVPNSVNQQLITDLQVLASPKMAGRRTGSDGHRLSYQYIIKRFNDIGLLPWRGSHTQRFAHPKLGKRFGTNVLGMIEGQSKSEQYIVVTAHYDHLGGRGHHTYHGADDNASGVAMMLALATYLKEHQPLVTVLFVATDAEEKGLLGSEQLIASNTVDSDKVLLNINLDMVGRAKRLYYLASWPKRDPVHQQVKMIEQSCLISRRTHRSFSNTKIIDYKKASDHYSFAKQGVDFVFVGGGQHADYHTPRDTAVSISPTRFSNRVGVIEQLYLIFEQRALKGINP
ncbi:MAG: M28 family peptidase [Psychrobium sp.]